MVLKFEPENLDKLFEPKFFDELVDDCYSKFPPMIREFQKKNLLESVQNKGEWWEAFLDKHMPFTTRCKKNTVGKDFEDNSDAKFCTVTRYSDGRYEATISGTANKVGTLRVIIVLDLPGMSRQKIYFLKIPHSFYSMRKGQNLKVYFKNFLPYGDIWHRFRCSFQEVIAP